MELAIDDLQVIESVFELLQNLGASNLERIPNLGVSESSSYRPLMGTHGKRALASLQRSLVF